MPSGFGMFPSPVHRLTACRQILYSSRLVIRDSRASFDSMRARGRGSLFEESQKSWKAHVLHTCSETAFLTS
jgi:hypothetical protein